MHALMLATSLLTSTLDTSEPEVKSKTNQKTETSLKGNYIGAFGGFGTSNPFGVSQKGAAFFPLSSGGPLPVVAKGHAHNETLDFVGVHLGHEWLRSSPSCCYWTQAVEIEGYYQSTKKKTLLTNPTDRLLPFSHKFKDTFSINMGVALANWVFVLNRGSGWKISPYIGVGIGAAMISIHHARATQVSPLEPGFNYFNSKPHDTDWTFATQGKAGLRLPVFKHFRFFAEYRFLYLTSSDYTFGSTKYPLHATTTKWDVHFNGICNNMYAFGIDLCW